MSYQVTDNLVIENAHIMFRNFAGEKSTYNREGRRNFCVKIEDPEYAQQLNDEGWNIKVLLPREEGDMPLHYLPVEVSYKYFPPKIYLITKRKRTLMTEDMVSSLDFADFKNLDMIIRPYNWTVQEKTGVKAYLNTMYVVLQEDAFTEKYAMEEFPEDDLPF